MPARPTRRSVHQGHDWVDAQLPHGVLGQGEMGPQVQVHSGGTDRAEKFMSCAHLQERERQSVQGRGVGGGCRNLLSSLSLAGGPGGKSGAVVRVGT